MTGPSPARPLPEDVVGRLSEEAARPLSETVAGPLSEEAALAVWERCESAAPADRARVVLEYAAAGIDVEDRSVGERDALLFDAYAATFGERVDATVGCQFCGELLEVAFDISALRGGYGDASMRFALPVPADGPRVSLRLPTPADLAAAARADSHETARAVLIGRCLEAADGQGDRVPLAALDGELIAAAAEEMARRDPQSAAAMQLTCDACGRAQVIPFAIEDFLWRRIAGVAAQLLDDVHELALAYGWSEAETLAVPAGRRHRYLERVNR